MYLTCLLYHAICLEKVEVGSIPIYLKTVEVGYPPLSRRWRWHSPLLLRLICYTVCAVYVNIHIYIYIVTISYVTEYLSFIKVNQVVVKKA